MPAIEHTMNPIIIKKNRVQLCDDAAKPTKAPGRDTSAAHASRKKVELVQHDGRVRALEITCSCGEITLVELEYPDNAAKS